MGKTWTLADMQSQAGKRFLITGANSGIGYMAALALARAGAVVMLACRDKARGDAALARMRQEAAGPDSAAPELVLLDLASLASVRAVADEFLSRHVALDGLINNAGVFAPPKRRETVDRFELQFGTNVLGHFALTCRLMPALEMAAAARVVTVASIAHKRGRLLFEDLQSLKTYSAQAAYQQSKLGDLMFALELERKLRAQGSRVVSVAVHPGVAKSNLFKIGNSTGFSRTIEQGIAGTVGSLLNDDAQGALPTVFGAVATEAQGGGYYGPQGLFEMRGGDVAPAKIAKQALDAGAQQQLWTVCEELTGCTLG